MPFILNKPSFYLLAVKELFHGRIPIPLVLLHPLAVLSHSRKGKQIVVEKD